MDEFILSLIKEPDKFKKLGIWLARSVLSVIVTAWIYKNHIGTYKIIDLTDLSAWVEFFMSGRVLICFLLYLVTDHVLFELFNLPVYMLLMLITNRVRKSRGLSKDIGSSVLFFLRLLDLLDFDRQKQKIKLMERSDELYDFVVSVRDQKGREEMHTLKQSFFSEITFTYLIFVLVYFTLLTPFNENLFLNKVVIAVLALVILGYISLSIFIDILRLAAPELIGMITFGKIEAAARVTFEKSQLHLHERDFPNIGNHSCFYYGEKHVLVDFCMTRGWYYGYKLDELAKTLLEINTKAILITDGSPAYSLTASLTKYQDCIFFIEAHDEKEISTKLDVVLAKHFPQET